MAGTPLIQSAPTVYTGALTVVAGSGELVNKGASTTIRLRPNVAPTAYTIVSAGDNDVHRAITSIADDATKGPAHCFVFMNSLYQINAVIASLSGYANGSRWGITGSANYSGGSKLLIWDPTQLPSGSLNGGSGTAKPTPTTMGFYIDNAAGGETLLQGLFVEHFFYGREIRVEGGTSTAGNEIDFNSISARDRLATVNAVAPFTGMYFGHVQEAGGFIKLNGPITIGNTNGTTVTHMLEKNTFALWATAPVAVEFYRIDIIGAATTVIWGDAAAPAPITIESGNARWALDTATDLPAEHSTYGITLKNGRAWKLGSTTAFDGGVLQDITDVAMNALTQIKNIQLISVRLDYGLPPVVGKLIGSTFKDPVDYCMIIATQTANMTIDYEFAASARGAGKAINFTHTSGDILITASAGYYQPVLADITVSGAGTVSFPAGISRNFGFTINNNITGYEWRLYQDSGVPGELGSVELAGEEISASIDHLPAYTYTYGVDTAVILQIIANGFEEKLLYFTLADADLTLNVILAIEENT